MLPVILVMLVILVAENFNNLRLKGWIFRNGINGHAEELCLQRLRQRDSQAQRIEVELIQSYAPCHNCADKIIAYKEEKEGEGKTVSIIIKFADYYRWIGPGTDEDGVKNLRKLKEMTESDIDLHLLQGSNSWENLIEDDELVNLNDDDQTRLLEKATSPVRINREGYDNDLCFNNARQTCNRMEELATSLTIGTRKFCLENQQQQQQHKLYYRIKVNLIYNIIY